MSLIGIILMWIWLAIAFGILNRWPMGKESAIRATYWAKFEDK